MQTIFAALLTQTPTILIVLSILLGSVVIARQLRVMSQASATRMGFPADIAALAGSVIFVITLLIGASIAFAQGGWGTVASSFMAGLGLGGVVVALAIQDVAKSYTAGIMLLYYRPYQVDDEVCITGVRGVVTAMRLHVTVLRNQEGMLVHIPSNAINGSAITNYTRSGLRKLTFGLTLPRNSPFESVIDVLPGIVQALPTVAPEPRALASISDMHGAQVTIQVMVWTAAEHDDAGTCRTEVILAIDAYLGSLALATRAGSSVNQTS
jgi:small conductance mechanosensitive channel